MSNDVLCCFKHFDRSQKMRTENLLPVLTEKPKKGKKVKRNLKKSYNKENTETPMSKKEPTTKMFAGLDVCKRLNRDPKSIYEELYLHKLTDAQLKMNKFPCEGFKPYTEVAADNSSRLCVRCGEPFEIYNGLYLASTKCSHHPRKARYTESGMRLHGCCDGPPGSPPCTVSNHHVTVQHRPRPLVKTSARRYVKKELQNTIFALDCEMSYTTEGLEVVRVALVNLEGHAMYDAYVKPKNKILDYNTIYSGVSQTHLQSVTVTLEDVKKILNGIIHEQTILVGHALNNDLAALGLVHDTVVDTSVMYADPRNPTKKPALKTLASEHLGLTIQESGHDCVADARATLELALKKVPIGLSSTPCPTPAPCVMPVSSDTPAPCAMPVSSDSPAPCAMPVSSDTPAPRVPRLIINPFGECTYFEPRNIDPGLFTPRDYELYKSRLHLIPDNCRSQTDLPHRIWMEIL